MKNVTYSGDNGNSTGPQPAAQDFSMNKISQSDTYNPNNYYHTGYFQSPNYDDWTTKFSQIAGDCVDLNTENPAVAEYVVDSYSKYMDMGVDGFRVDTVRHIPRVSLNIMFNDQLMDAAKAAGKPNFYMFAKSAQDTHQFGIVAMPRSQLLTTHGKSLTLSGQTAGTGAHQLQTSTTT